MGTKTFGAKRLCKNGFAKTFVEKRLWKNVVVKTYHYDEVSNTLMDKIYVTREYTHSCRISPIIKLSIFVNLQEYIPAHL